LGLTKRSKTCSRVLCSPSINEGIYQNDVWDGGLLCVNYCLVSASPVMVDIQANRYISWKSCDVLTVFHHGAGFMEMNANDPRPKLQSLLSTTMTISQPTLKPYIKPPQWLVVMVAVDVGGCFPGCCHR